ncbi:winged helix-turn-helix transcriptional regulator [archaeon]|nr:winged helix-turn-helix transcriptional regulator [archaeon]
MSYELKIFKALSDKTRLEIVSSLLEGELCVCDITSYVKRSQPTVSLQLKKLVELGILMSVKNGKKRLYRISDHKVCDALRLLGNKRISKIKNCCRRLKK